MKKIIIVFAAWVLSCIAVFANEISNIRAAVMADKTRIVFDLKEKGDYTVEIRDPYQVILHFNNTVSAPLKHVSAKKLGKIVESVTPIAISGGVSYVFNLKYAVKPVHAQLAPQGNYRNYRVYIDFINDRIAGNPRDPGHKLEMPKITAENTPKPLNSVADSNRKNVPSPAEANVQNVNNAKNGKPLTDQQKIDAVRVLTPEEAERRRIPMQKANESIVANYEKEQRNNTVNKPSAAANNRPEPKPKPVASDSRTEPKSVKPDRPDERIKPAADVKNADLNHEKNKPGQQIADQKNIKNEPKQVASGSKNDRPENKPSAQNSVQNAKNQNNSQHQAKPGNSGAVNNPKIASHDNGGKVAGADAGNKKTESNGKCVKSPKVVVAIDPGHGGKDPGAIGANGVQEKTVTLGIAKHLYQMINRSRDMKAVLIRSGDHFIGLDDRSEIARKHNADLLISIHADAAANSSASGASVLVLNNDRAGRENRKMLNTKNKHDELLGGASNVLEETALIGENDSYMQNMIIDLTSDKSRDAGYDLANKIIAELSKFATMHKKRPDERSLAVLKAPDIPSILVETGFVSNVREEAKLKTSDYQKKIATAIYNALRTHLKNPKYHLSPDRHCKRR